MGAPRLQTPQYGYSPASRVVVLTGPSSEWIIYGTTVVRMPCTGRSSRLCITTGIAVSHDEA